MGVSPGDFTDGTKGYGFHWELRKNTIVLWNSDESECLLELDIENAVKALHQLEVLVEMDSE